VLLPGLTFIASPNEEGLATTHKNQRISAFNYFRINDKTFHHKSRHNLSMFLSCRVLQIKLERSVSDSLQKCRQRPRSPLARPPDPPSLMSLRASTQSTSTREYAEYIWYKHWEIQKADWNNSCTASHSRSGHHEQSRRSRPSQQSQWYENTENNSERSGELAGRWY
jgi:hypothetical protein